MDAHIFADNSNIFGGAQRAAQTLEPHVPWFAMRVYYHHLFQVVEGTHNVITRQMTGSVPPGNEDLWRYAREEGYNTDLLRRVESDDGRLIEQGVDELLHLKIGNALLDFDPPQTLVIVSGDGRDTPTGSSFPAQVRRALKRGWNVEIWSWKEQCTSAYRRMISNGEGRGRLIERYLDSHYKSVTFVKGGVYDVGGQQLILASRDVEALPASVASSAPAQAPRAADFSTASEGGSPPAGPAAPRAAGPKAAE